MTAQVLIIADRLEMTPSLLRALKARAQQEPPSFHLVLTNPERAEFHLRHVDRHEGVARSQAAARAFADQLGAEVGVEITSHVSIRHDPLEAVEEELMSRPVDEILVAVHEGSAARRFHHDLPHRLRHLHVPTRVVDSLGSTESV